MANLTLQPNKEDAGSRIDAWLAANVEGLTRSAAARLLEEGLVLLNGKAPASTSRRSGGRPASFCRCFP